MTRAGTPGRAALVVLAGGSGSRLGAPVNKVYLPLGGRPVLAWSLRCAAQVHDVVQVVVVARQDDDALIRAALQSLADGDPLPARRPAPPVDLVPGGPSRHASEANGVRHLAPRILAGEIDVVAVHDGARPLAGAALLAQVLDTARRLGGAVPGVPAPHLLPTAGRGGPVAAVAPSGQRLVRVQTPQAFRARELLAAFDAADAAGFEGTDTAATAHEYGGLRVRLVPGTARNLKVTYPQDLALAERLLALEGAPA